MKKNSFTVGIPALVFGLIRIEGFIPKSPLARGRSMAERWLVNGGKKTLNIVDLFKNPLNQPVIVYDTTNQSHSQGMAIATMPPVRI
jgi:hypothetical protein